MARSSNFLSYQIPLASTLPEGYLPLELLCLATNDIKNEEDKIFLIKIQTVRKGKKPSRAVDVYFYYPGQNQEARVVGILREE